MIRFLQSKDNRLVKAIFIVIIGAAVITMVVTLIPGIFQDAAVTADTYATVYPHWYSRFTFTGEKISMTRVQEIAQQQMQRQRLPEQYASMFMPRFMAQAGQQLILQKILLAKAASLGIVATDDDVRSFLKTGQLGEYLFPKGQFIGEDKYKQFVSQQFSMTTGDFEKAVADDIEIQRLRSLITAGVTVSDNEIRDTYKKQNIKIKFDYAVISQDDLRKQINPSDADLQAFFTKNAARYANAVPEERKITYFAFTADQVPGGAPKVSDQEIQAYFQAHQAEYQVPEQSKSRHILIKFPGGTSKTDAEAKAKAEALLKQIKAGGDFAELAKKNSEDPGSGAQGGELGFARKGAMVPEFDNAIFTQKIGDVTLVHTQFGYHIIQVEERQEKHDQPLAEVKPAIEATLIRQKETASEAAYAGALAAEAQKNGLAKTAAAHHLEVVTTPSLNAQGIIPGLPDGSQVISKAFSAKLNGDPQSAQSGEGYAIFQVTGITAAHAPTFADWKSKVATDYADERLPQLLAEKTKELADKAKADHDLAKAAKEVGATVKTSDLVGDQAQVPDLGQLGSVAPQLFNLNPGDISGPINAQRTGVVAKIDDKVSPTPDEIAKNLDQTRDQILNQRQEEVFGIFVSNAQDEYKKAKLIAINAKVAKQQPGLGDEPGQ
jgi:peptidyl-prolyl cis-trans isomerase D